MDFKEKEYWYLLQTRINQHHKALQNLINQDFNCFSPNIATKSNLKKVSDNRIEPLFPGYIFIRLGENCNWTAAQSTRGVSRFVKFGLYPAKVPDTVVNQIKSDLSRYANKKENISTFKPGDRVSIVNSSFDCYDAIFKCRAGNNRSIILINILEQMREIEISSELVQSLSTQ